MSAWGLLPEAVLAQIRQREWDNSRNLRGRLSGERAFPLRMSLKTPTGAQALADLEHFRLFLHHWQQWRQPLQLEWQQKKYQQLGEQRIPVALSIASMPELIAVLGTKAEARSQRWQQLMQPLLSLNSRLSAVLVKQLTILESMTIDDTALLAHLLPQLQSGMGQGQYLRALPLHGVDTKFVENYQTLVMDCLDCLHDDAVTLKGGLLPWLDCCPTPRGWLMVRPLCPQSREQLGGLPLLQMDITTLQQYSLPASHILIVENKQSGYALPYLQDTIAVFGGGRNIAWMQAEWLQHKDIHYWGDIDSWGLTILSEARGHQPQLKALMMDEATLLLHQSRMVNEVKSYPPVIENLNAAEQQLLGRLREGYYGKNRLEQERLSPDYVHQCLDSC